MAVIVGVLGTGIGSITIVVSVLSFNLLWIFVDGYQMVTVANLDQSGSYVSLMPDAS